MPSETTNKTFVRNDSENLRPILFRVWDTKEKKMYYYQPFSSFYRFFYTLSGITYKEGVFQKHLCLLQATGLFDKNDNLIYEGDIIKAKKKGTKKEVTGVVKWDTKRAGFILHGVDSYNFGTAILSSVFDREIVGNEFEDPDFFLPF
jgi:uncharacterized phage protein (TIGR01671 family)